MSSYKKYIGNPQSFQSVGTDFEDLSLISGTKYQFLTGIVKEVISNPEEFIRRPHVDDSTGKTSKDSAGNKLTIGDVCNGKGDIFLNIQNPELAEYMPINSVITSIIDNNNVDKSSHDVICFPFFPPHISLPLKPGEYIWIVKEDIKGNDYYFWMCRKVGFRQIDDLNITHAERLDNTVEAFSQHLTKPATTNNKLENIVNFFNSNDTNLYRGESFENIQKSSVAFKEEFTGEPVPRYVKNCSDLLIQGSNNAHISLGTEKFSKFTLENLNTPEYYTGRNRSEVVPERNPVSPAIDICIGRKLNDIMNLKNISSNTATGENFNIVKAVRVDKDTPTLENYEIDKVSKIQNKEQNLQEFVDNDATNCMSRIYMSNASNIDSIFKIPDINDQNITANISDSMGNGNFSSLVAYSANSRIVGTETVKISNSNGSSMIAMSKNGDVTIESKGGAKIILDGQGDIRIVPGANGKVYIGGEKNDSGITPVGSGQPGTPSNLDSQIVTSAAGLVGQPGGTGMFSTKVKIK